MQSRVQIAHLRAVFTAASSKMKTITGRMALVLLSDGLDTGGRNTLTDAIETAQGVDMPVYAMVLNPFHELRIETSRAGVTIRARKGYQAAGPGQSGAER
jgi:hypothetical protein